MNPQFDAAERARAIIKREIDGERRHAALDELLCQILERHGYDDLVNVYLSTTRFYG